MKKILSFFAAMLFAGSMMATDVSVTIYASSGDYYAKTHEWVKGDQAGATPYDQVVLDNVISANLIGTGNNGKYYSDWRFYTKGSDDGSFSIDAAEGYALKSVTLTYTVSNSGALYMGETKLASKTPVDVSGRKAVFQCKNTNTSDNGQVRLTAIAVTYEAEGGDVPPVEDAVYTVVGSSAALFGKAWTPEMTENDMTKANEGYYVWSKKGVTLPDGEIEYKVVTDHNWEGEQYPASGNYAFSLPEGACYNVTITLYPGDKAEAVWEKEGDVVIDPTAAVLGQFNNWDETAGTMVLSEDKKTASLGVTMPAGDYEFKMYINGGWRSNGYTFHRDFTSADGITGNNDANMIVKADQEGLYVFTWTFETSALAITFPEKSDPVDPNQMYIWDGSGAKEEDAIEKGGKAEAVQADGTNIAVGVSQKGNWCLKANKGFNDGKYYLGIALDNAVNAGDQIVLGFFRTTDKNTYILGMDFSADKESASTDYQILTTDDPEVLTSNGVPSDVTFNVPEGVKDAKYIRIYRNSGSTGLWVSKFAIIKGGDVPPVVEDKYYMKNNWDNGSEWYWKEMSKSVTAAGLFVLEDAIYGGTGVNFNTEEKDETATWVPEDQFVIAQELKLEPKDTANFLLNPKPAEGEAYISVVNIRKFQDVPVVGCNWDDIEWFNVGLGEGDENFNQFKICKAGELPNVVNIQTAPWADNNKGIYINFPSAEFTTISLPEGQYKVDGAGILLFLSAFSATETEVSILYKGEPVVFTVYNAKVDIPEVKYYMKNNWDNGSEWYWKEMEKDSESAYKLANVVFGGTGVNWKQGDNGTEAWVELAKIVVPEGITLEAKDTLDFILDPVAEVVSARNIRKFNDGGDVPPVVEDKYYMKNNWDNGSEWYWKEMEKDDETNYKLANVVFGGTGVNWKQGDNGTEAWVELAKIVVPEGITLEAKDTLDFILDPVAEVVSARNIRKFNDGGDVPPVGTPLYYITGESLVGSWEPNALPVYEKSLYEFESVKAGSYSFKITVDGTWATAKGYDDLTLKQDGLSKDNDGNICFTLAEDGPVAVLYTDAEFVVRGNFVVPEPPVSEWDEIIFKETDVADKGQTAKSFVSDTNEKFVLSVTDDDSKIAIDANSARFGTPVLYAMYRHRLKTGGKSSAKNALSLAIPADGQLRIAVRTGSNGATDRTLVLKQNDVELFNSVIQESDAQAVDEDGTEVNVYPYVTVNVKAGNVAVEYPVNGLNFYEFGFKAGEVPPVVDHTYSVVGPLTPGGWDATSTACDMVLGADGIYRFTLEGVTLATNTDYEYKIVQDHSWAVAFPEQGNATFRVEKSGIYDLAFSLDLNAEVPYAVVPDLKEEIVVIPSVAMHGNFTGGWGDTDDFTLAEDQQSASLKLTLAKGNYEFGMRIGGKNNWMSNGVEFTRENPSAVVEAGSGNLKLAADVEGEYTFTWIFERSTLVITFPEAGPVEDPTVAVIGSMTQWQEAIPFTLSEDKKSAKLVVDKIPAGQYEFKMLINGQYRSNGYRYHRDFPGAAGISEDVAANMVLDVDAMGEFTFIWFFETDSLYIIFPEIAPCEFEDGLYIVGTMNNWEKSKDYMLEINSGAEGEYWCELNLNEGDEFKILWWAECKAMAWIPGGEQNIIVTREYAGKVRVYFRPEGNPEWPEKYYYIEVVEPQNINNTEANTKVVKMLENGQLFIQKGGKTYNVLGTLVK